MTGYSTLTDGARALLVDSVNCVSPTGHSFVVVGGWSPVLLNSSQIPHPGTVDVDLLFEGGATEHALREVVEALVGNGFHPSAKHPFQLLRAVPVLGQYLVFNVDLLHPSEALTGRPSAADMFVDHIELEIPIGARADERFRAKSIAAPHSGFIFKDRRFVSTPVSVTDSDGVEHRADVPVIDELALLVTKSKSVALPKRPRDAFDIYLAIRYARDPEQLLASATELQQRTPEAFLSLSSIREVLVDGSFDRRVNDYLPDNAKVADPSELQSLPFSTIVTEFLDEAGVPNPETA